MTDPAMITLATITDRCDFGKQLACEAFASRADAEAWAADKAADILAAADEPDYCDPVAEYADIWLNPLSPEERQRQEQREAARAASAYYNRDNATD